MATSTGELQQQVQEVGRLITRTSNFEDFVKDITERTKRTTEELKETTSKFDAKTSSTTEYSRELTSLALTLGKASEENTKRIQDLIGFQLYIAPTFHLM